MKFYLCLIAVPCICVSNEMLSIMQRKFMCSPCFYHQQAHNSSEQLCFGPGCIRFWQRAHGLWQPRSNQDISKTGSSISATWETRTPMGIAEEMESFKQATFPRNSWYYFRKQNLLKGTGILPDLVLKKEGKKKIIKGKN